MIRYLLINGFMLACTIYMIVIIGLALGI